MSVVSGLLGGGFVRNATKSDTVTVDPARFTTDVGSAMTAVEAAMAAQVEGDLVVR